MVDIFFFLYHILIVRLETFKQLSVDELEYLNCIVNGLEPKILPYEIPISLFTSIKHKFLMDRLTFAEKHIKPEHIEFYKELYDKLTK